ncbi:MAG: aminotransferase class V-fold PLP-dependent enzyme [Methylococcales bacterium]
MYKEYYRRFLALHPGEIHFTAHSHHFWPDVTREAVLCCWDDSARFVDDKWSFILEQIMPDAQELIARWIGSDTPRQIVFGASTHEFICRLLSCFEPGSKLSILTTDSEFHSFWRQVRRLAEEPWVTIETVAVEAHESFNRRFLKSLERQSFDLVFLSQVFFNSGRAIADLESFMTAVAESVRPETLIVLDGYHGFCALPTRIAPFADRVFYLAGGYKYAQAGEGVCFLHSPPGCVLRPRNTGWFADFAGLSSDRGGPVDYPTDGSRFAGATFDPSGIYRLKSVLELFASLDLDCEKIHAYVKTLQETFIASLDRSKHPDINRDNLLVDPDQPYGHFLTFRLASQEQTAMLRADLKKAGIHADHRGNQLRFGFGLYHDTTDIEAFFKRLSKM